MSNRQYTIYTKEGNVKLSTINENEAWFNLDREAGDTLVLTGIIAVLP